MDKTDERELINQLIKSEKKVLSDVIQNENNLELSLERLFLEIESLRKSRFYARICTIFLFLSLLSLLIIIFAVDFLLPDERSIVLNICSILGVALVFAGYWWFSAERRLKNQNFILQKIKQTRFEVEAAKKDYELLSDIEMEMRL